MSTPMEMDRESSPPGPGSGPFVCGAAEIDITPHPGMPLAGFSLEGEMGEGVYGHLFARALYLRDERGEEAVLCVLDMMSASRLLLEMIAFRTNRMCGLGVDRILLVGTHTHTGPGWFYGNTLYDTFAVCKAGFDPGLCKWIADRVANTIGQAKSTAKEGGVVIGQGKLWDVSRNRSFGAWSDASQQEWRSTGFPGGDHPTGLYIDQVLIDPRVTVLVASQRGKSGPVAVFGFFGCHATTLGHKAPFYSADWPGLAVLSARDQLERHFSDGQIMVAMGAGPQGDVNGWRYDLTPKIDPGPELMRFVGERIGARVAEVATAAVSEASPKRVDIWYAEPSVTDPPPESNEPVALAERWYFGTPTAGGSEESRTLLHKLGLAREGQTSGEFPTENPQRPKARAGWVVQNFLKAILRLDPSPRSSIDGAEGRRTFVHHPAGRTDHPGGT